MSIVLNSRPESLVMIGNPVIYKVTCSSYSGFTLYRIKLQLYNSVTSELIDTIYGVPDKDGIVYLDVANCLRDQMSPDIRPLHQLGTSFEEGPSYIYFGAQICEVYTGSGGCVNTIDDRSNVQLALHGSRQISSLPEALGFLGSDNTGFWIRGYSKRSDLSPDDTFLHVENYNPYTFAVDFSSNTSNKEVFTSQYYNKSETLSDPIPFGVAISHPGAIPFDYKGLISGYSTLLLSYVKTVNLRGTNPLTITNYGYLNAGLLTGTTWTQAAVGLISVNVGTTVKLQYKQQRRTSGSFWNVELLNIGGVSQLTTQINSDDPDGLIEFTNPTNAIYYIRVDYRSVAGSYSSNEATFSIRLDDSDFDHVQVGVDLIDNTTNGDYNRVFNSAYISEALSLISKCKNGMQIIWRNDRGGTSSYMFSYSQDFFYSYQNGYKAKRFRLFADELTLEDYERLEELHTLGAVYQNNFFYVNSDLKKTSTRYGAAVYFVNSLNGIIDEYHDLLGVIVIPTENPSRTKNIKHRFEIEIEMPETFTL